MITIQGPIALSSFRKLKLLAKIKSVLPIISTVEASYLHFVDLKTNLTTLEYDTLVRLLEYDFPIKNAPNTGILIAPRQGTVSPWSSKATEIVQNCGLQKIKRVERGIIYTFFADNNTEELALTPEQVQVVLPLIHDRMTENIVRDKSTLFAENEEKPLLTIPLMQQGRAALVKANVELGLALSDDEIEYLDINFNKMKRDPTDVELVMFAQANSEHCRHKIFNADWVIDGESKDTSLFAMIKNTHKKSPEGTKIAYKDNAAVIQGHKIDRFLPKGDGRTYEFYPVEQHIVAKVETHNHPTAICPFPGASTGTGGEIRDESATGVGGKPKAGLAAFFVSNLNIPNLTRPWEKEYAEFPDRLATPFRIMIDAPLGAAAFGNEFGRPNLTGIFRSYEELISGTVRGYHKPIMTAGGVGTIEETHVNKKDLQVGDLIIQLGGPAMRIGLGGGAASSMDTGSNKENLDFDSVQRDNPEMERRCQEVIDACVSLGAKNPIRSIHDVGAGGLSNACPELVAEVGATFLLREINCSDNSLSPMEIWCNESQERYMLAISPESLHAFEKICLREKCPMAVLGEVTGDHHLKLHDAKHNNNPIDMEISVLLGKPPKMTRNVKHKSKKTEPFDISKVNFGEALERVLRLPAVGDKSFLITIGDRTVTGMVTRDQMIGPYQIPVSDAAVTVSGYTTFHGEAMGMGERTPVALLNAPASGRMAIAEALTNILSSDIQKLNDIKLSANWMAACGVDGEDADLFDTVKAVGLELCPALGISIPVGKDSMSMRTTWQDSRKKTNSVVSPLSLLITAFAPVFDVRKTITPELKIAENKADIYLFSLSDKTRLGASSLGQVYNQLGVECPDVDSASILKDYLNVLIQLKKDNLILAYHDRSDGGLIVSLLEMAFTVRKGLNINLSTNQPLDEAFNEEIGVLLQISEIQFSKVLSVLKSVKLESRIQKVAEIRDDQKVVIKSQNGSELYQNSISVLKSIWSETSFAIQKNRDNPECAESESKIYSDPTFTGITYQLNFDPAKTFHISKNVKPKIAILREQGVNGHIEMAAAFHLAGFTSVDVTMSDLLTKQHLITDFQGLVSCGGFSYGDVLGAGSGWAKTILFNERLKDSFREFFNNPQTFSLGVCNGCQMLSQLKDLVPGADLWPRFVRNISEQFEARFVTVKINKSPSVLLKSMEESILAIACAHGEGLVHFDDSKLLQKNLEKNLISMQFVDSSGKPTERYPLNPNGSQLGATAFTTTDGRATIMMPHPERLFRSVQYSWKPKDWGEFGPWMQIFRAANEFVK